MSRGNRTAIDQPTDELEQMQMIGTDHREGRRPGSAHETLRVPRSKSTLQSFDALANS